MSASWTTILSTNSCRSWGVNAVGSVYFFTIFRKLLTLTACSPPKYLVFFKARDADALTSAFTEYTQKKVRKASRPSVLAKLNQFKELVKNAVVDRTKRKELER